MTAAKAPVSPMPAYTLEFRASEHPNAPTLTITGADAAQLQDRVDTALANSLFALAGKAQEQMTASYTLGNLLGATAVDAPKASMEEPQAPAVTVVYAGAAAEPQTPAAAQALEARKEAAKAAEAVEEPATPWGGDASAGAEWPPKPDPAPAPAAQAAPAATPGGWPPAPAWAS